MTILDLFERADVTAIGLYGRESTYFFPAVEVVHLLGLTMLLGAVLVLNLRLLGAGMKRQPVQQIAMAVAPYLWIGAGITIATGVLLFLTEAIRCYYNIAFWCKMVLLIMAVLFQLTVHRKLNSSPALAPRAAASTGIVSLLLWFGVGVAGRAIGVI